MYFFFSDCFHNQSTVLLVRYPVSLDTSNIWGFSPKFRNDFHSFTLWGKPLILAGNQQNFLAMEARFHNSFLPYFLDFYSKSSGPRFKFLLFLVAGIWTPPSVTTASAYSWRFPFFLTFSFHSFKMLKADLGGFCPDVTTPFIPFSTRLPLNPFSPVAVDLDPLHFLVLQFSSINTFYNFPWKTYYRSAWVWSLKATQQCQFKGFFGGMSYAKPINAKLLNSM